MTINPTFAYPHNIYETQCYQEGYRCIGGIDEVGRGCIAGPVVAACVILNTDFDSILKTNYPDIQLMDSKKCRPSQRTILYSIITRHSRWAVAEISPQEIDTLNIHYASLRAMGQTIQHTQPDAILVDGKFLPQNQRDFICDTPIKGISIIKGDTISQSIAAASIIAKVWRDRLMCRYAIVYPTYQFQQHKGYPTTQHIQAIHDFGILPIHRKSFKTIKNISKS